MTALLVAACMAGKRKNYKPLTIMELTWYDIQASSIDLFFLNKVDVSKNRVLLPTTKHKLIELNS
jgi:hypothetical protein